MMRFLWFKLPTIVTQQGQCHHGKTNRQQPMTYRNKRFDTIIVLSAVYRWRSAC